MNSPGWQVPSMLLEISGEVTPERMKRWSQSKNNTQQWMELMMEVNSDALKNNTVYKSWNNLPTHQPMDLPVKTDHDIL